MVYSDLTGQLPHISSRVNTYLLTIYDYDVDAILVAPFKFRQSKEIAMKWETKHLQLTRNNH